MMVYIDELSLQATGFKYSTYTTQYIAKIQNHLDLKGLKTDRVAM